MTISPDLVSMRLGNTKHHHGTARTCVPSRQLQHRLCMGKGVSGRSQIAYCPHCTQQCCTSYLACALSSLSGMFVLSSSVCCLLHRSGACNACRDAGNASPGVNASVAAFSQLHGSESPAPARVSLACLCMRADFVRWANRLNKHKVLCVCVLGPWFLCALDYFCNRVTCWSGQTSAISSLSGHIVGFCMHARSHTGLRAHVTFFHGKRLEECYNPDCACPYRRVLLVSPETHQGEITGKPNHDKALRARLWLPPCVDTHTHTHKHKHTHTHIQLSSLRC